MDAVIAAAGAAVAHTPDNNPHFHQSPSSHAAPAAAVSAVAVAAALAAVAAAACRSSAEIGKSALAARWHRDVEPAHTQAWDAEPVVVLLSASRTAVATERWVASAKKRAAQMHW